MQASQRENYSRNYLKIQGDMGEFPICVSCYVDGNFPRVVYNYRWFRRVPLERSVHLATCGFFLSQCDCNNTPPNFWQARPSNPNLSIRCTFTVIYYKRKEISQKKFGQYSTALTDLCLPCEHFKYHHSL